MATVGRGLPDPCGGPQPVRLPLAADRKAAADARSGKAASYLVEAVAGVVAAGGIAAMVLTTCVLTSCPGATRSARVQWEQRQAEIGRVMQETRGGAQGAEQGEAPASGGEHDESGSA